ncbi:DUF3419 family protein [Streptomyces roseolus]|uniref:DUF3419 family protein n=1 Tax=Streptomyces roseolus TaxID=67358 RepID=UPI0036FBF871
MHGTFASITALPPVYSEVLEDEGPIRSWLRAGPGDTVLSIASGGDNVLNLALDGPAKVYGLDISPAQTAYCRAKSAALGGLPHDAAMRLLGVHDAPAEERARLLDEVLAAAGTTIEDPAARELALRQGLLQIGAFEQLVGVVRAEIHKAVPDRVLRSLMTERDHAERLRLWKREDIAAQLLPVFRLFFAEDSLKDVFTPASFHDIFDCSPFPEFLLSVIERRLVEDDPTGNYYMHRWCFGGYLPGGALPPYLRADRNDRLKEALPRVEWATGHLLEFLGGLADGEVRGYNLSNVLDWCENDYVEQTFDQLTRTAAPGARVFVRSFLKERPFTAHAAKLGWVRDPGAEAAAKDADRVGYYPHYQLWELRA